MPHRPWPAYSRFRVWHHFYASGVVGCHLPSFSCLDLPCKAFYRGFNLKKGPSTRESHSPKAFSPRPQAFAHLLSNLHASAPPSLNCPKSELHLSVTLGIEGRRKFIIATALKHHPGCSRFPKQPVKAETAVGRAGENQLEVAQVEGANPTMLAGNVRQVRMRTRAQVPGRLSELQPILGGEFLQADPSEFSGSQIHDPPPSSEPSGSFRLRLGCGFCRTSPRSAELSGLSALESVGLTEFLIRGSGVRVPPRLPLILLYLSVLFSSHFPRPFHFLSIRNPMAPSKPVEEDSK